MFAAEHERRSPAMVGTSGFSYSDWKGLFYPPKLASRAWLGYYATRFDAVEINLTFYRSASAATLSRWLGRRARALRLHAQGQPDDHAPQAACRL